MTPAASVFRGGRVNLGIQLFEISMAVNAVTKT
jgi:hypothetical protein